MKPFFSNNVSNVNTIKLVEKDEIIQCETQVANTLNSFFENAVSKLNITENKYILNHDYLNIVDPIDKAIVKYELHPSILTIKEKIGNSNSFYFEQIGLLKIGNEIKNINTKKASSYGNIPPKILKLFSIVSSPALKILFNESLDKCVFPEDLKLADLIPVFKKNDPLDKANYRPISLLPIVSKVFEKLIQKQINNYIRPHLSPYLCGFRKGFNTQQALLSLIENWKRVLDKQGFGGAVLMDLSKAFDTLNHELLIAKLHAYGFSKCSLRYLHSYLTKRWQRTKVGIKFSSWSELIQGSSSRISPWSSLIQYILK